MSFYALWIDHQHATVFKFTKDGVEETKLESHGHPDHHTHGKGDQKKHDHEKFYHEVSLNLRDVKELMIMGPGTAKDEFKHHCENHSHKNLAQSIVGVQTMAAHPTKATMLEKANQWFKTYHMYTKNY